MGCIVADLATHHQAAVAAAVVLIVEDDADIGSLLAELLTDEGYAGFAAVLPKPFEIDDLLRVIAGAVSQFTSRSGA